VPTYSNWWAPSSRALPRRSRWSGWTLTQLWIGRAQRIHTQRKKDKNKLYALHAPEAECISKGKARQRYEFGVKSSLATTHRQGLTVGARSFPGNPFDGHTLAAQLEQTNTLLQDIGVAPVTFRRIGATAFSASWSHAVSAVMEPLRFRHIGATQG
jgi:hypothetical protein